jgi:hypothetical protein
MPLLDHFRPPLADRRDWHSFHNHWAAAIAADLNTRLPSDYFAEANVQYGIEIDVGVMEELGPAGEGSEGDAWRPTAATLTVPFAVETDVAEVRVYRQFGGRLLVGAVELVSPSNKDRPESREAFVTKCEAYLRRGAGVVVIDVVTERGGNLDDLLMERVSPAAPASGAELYAAAYRPFGSNGSGQLSVWREELAVGRPLPELPLWLLMGPCVRVRLEETYLRVCRELRIPVTGTRGLNGT